MAQSKGEIQSILSAAGMSPRHRFGQNFMIDQNLVRLVADAGEIQPGDLVIEVGPGTGTLTDELLTRADRLLAVEIDRDLARALRDKHAGQPKFTLIESDALASKHQLAPALSTEIASAIADQKRCKLVANLPYNIACPLVIELLIAGVELAVFTVQKEVADRLRASPASEHYGPLSVMAQLLGIVELLRTLPPQAFWPAPKVDSALVKITRNDKTIGHATRVSRFVHDVFSYRRKTLRKALTQAGHNPDPILLATQLDGKARPEQFQPADFLNMWKHVNT